MKTWIKEGKFTELSSDSLKNLTVEELSAYDSDRIEAKETQLNDLIAKNEKTSSDAIKALEAEVAKLKEADYTAMKNQLKSQGLEMTKLVEKVEASTKGETAGFTHQVLKGLKENSDSIKDMLKSGSGRVVLDIKAEQGAADITTGTDFAIMEQGVGQIATREPFMRSIFRTQPIASEYLKYNDQETIVRDAKNVAACAASTHTSKITWQVRTLQITKVRDFVDVCIDMMDDYDFVEGEIRNLVSTDVELKIDQQLLLGTNIYPETNSVDAVSSTFAAGSYAAAIADATVIDLLKIAGAQIADFGQNNAFNADTVAMNPVDFCKMQLEKDANGVYLIPNWITSDGVNIGAMRIVANQLVPANQAYVMDSTKGTIFQRRGRTVELAFENKDNFEKELVTVKAYERLNLRVRNVDANAFMHIADIAAAVVAINKP